ncbi:lysylphosphatidylglycerol synthase domain-containing protein [Salinisphaera aquimarina]|uniref:Lysylphosphatidylglycerol synthase domain-containing protein n=1 Tax=Salinisphaera aquimarina TaxID=2094031 RepID=A0ABV7EVI7_9GAMM
MKRTAIIMALLGVALFTAVLLWQGAGDIANALAAAGWGLLLVAAWHLLPLVIDSHAWRLLFARSRPSLGRIVWARWIGESVNGLLPVAQVGGDVAKARLLVLCGHRGAPVGASVVVDTTLAVATQMVFALIGVAMLLALLDRPDLAWGLIAGIAVMAVLVGVFYRLQRGGLFGGLAGLVQKLGGGAKTLDFVGGARALDQAVAHIYRQPGTVARAAFWRLIGWLAGVGEVWLALYFLGAPVSLADALMLEALGQAVRGAAFAIPGALGVQEGGYVLLGSLIGLPADVSLALSLSKRVRELAFGVPGLIAWQIAEGRALRRTPKHFSVQE